MSIFLLPTTPKNAIPSAAESKALSIAYQQFAANNIGAARQTLFSTFSPAAAEAHFDDIRRRHAPQVPMIVAPRPQMQTSPLIRLVRIGLFAGLAIIALNALTSR